MGKYLEHSMQWLDFIDNGWSLKEQLKGVTKWVEALECLMKLEEEEAIKIITPKYLPSSITWNVLNEEAYQKVQAKYGLPTNIKIDWAKVLEGKTQAEAAELFDALRKDRDTHRKERLE